MWGLFICVCYSLHVRIHESILLHAWICLFYVFTSKCITYPKCLEYNWSILYTQAKRDSEAMLIDHFLHHYSIYFYFGSTSPVYVIICMCARMNVWVGMISILCQAHSPASNDTAKCRMICTAPLALPPCTISTLSICLPRLAHRNTCMHHTANNTR